MAEKMQELKERVDSGEFIQSSEEVEKTDLAKLSGFDEEKLKSDLVSKKKSSKILTPKSLAFLRKPLQLFFQYKVS